MPTGVTSGRCITIVRDGVRYHGQFSRRRPSPQRSPWNPGISRSPRLSAWPSPGAAGSTDTRRL